MKITIKDWKQYGEYSVFANIGEMPVVIHASEKMISVIGSQNAVKAYALILKKKNIKFEVQ